MKNRSRRNFIEGFAALPFIPILTEAQEKITAVVFKGRVVNLAEILSNQFQVKLETEKRGMIYCLKTLEGQLHPFLPTDSASAIYDDERVRKRELQITARTFPDSQYLEVIKIQSIKWGRVYDLFYYCIVCNLSSHKPGPCECCQAPLEFTERLNQEK